MPARPTSRSGPLASRASRRVAALAPLAVAWLRDRRRFVLFGSHRDVDAATRERRARFLRERFVERRRAAVPEWADADAFDHYYAVMILASVAESDLGATLRVGDDVSVLD